MSALIGHVVDEFLAEMQGRGIEPSDRSVIIADGALHRFHVEGDKRGSRNGWYVLYADGIPAGAFGTWKDGDASHSWCAAIGREWSNDEAAEHHRRMDAARAARDGQIEQEREACRSKCAELFKNATQPGIHVYLAKKSVRAYGIRQHDGALLVPVRDAAGVLHGLQFIQGGGSKKFAPGTAKVGHYHAIGKPQPSAVLAIAEGYATGATVHELTGWPVAVAFDAGNLRPVAEALRAKLPNVRLVICADNDHGTAGNPGLSKAHEAAQAVGGIVIAPDFEPGDKGTDWNDYAAQHGEQATRDAMMAASIGDATNFTNSTNNQQQNGFYRTNTDANSVRNGGAESGWDALMTPPVAVSAMFYGPLGSFALQAAEGTEVNPVAAMAAVMTWFGTSVGRNRAIAVGDGWHRLNLFTLHVGRSSRGGKGMALDLLKRVIKAVVALEGGGAISAQIHTGGLSTREGLALLIHDGYRNGTEDVPAIPDKRLFIVEPEFANVLAQGKREGNTLSTCLRDAWDGIGIRPATKSCRVWASRPHIGLHGCITPTELRAKLSSNDLTNGFANRFLIVWAERTGIMPFPARAPDAAVSALAVQFAELIRAGLVGYPASDEVIRLDLSLQAKEFYAECYAEFSRPHPGGELISGLLQRRAPMLLRISGIFATADGLNEISLAHIEAARAWMDYYAQSVAMIFGPAVDAEGEANRNEDAEKLWHWLAEAGDWRSRTAISSECFKRNLSKASLSAALERLAMEHRIERREVDTGGTRKQTQYRAVQGRQFVQGSSPRSYAEGPAPNEASLNSLSSSDSSESLDSRPPLAPGSMAWRAEL